MQKRVFMVHGWDGHPDNGWFPWLKTNLEQNGFEVIAPSMPDPESPHINTWVPFLASVVGEADENTYFVGHSMGCQAITRYLETLPESVKVGGVVYVAGFFKRLTSLEPDEEVQAIAKEWLTTPIDFAKVKSHVDQVVAIFSDNDYYVPLDNQDDFRDKLGAEIIVVSNQGHFSGPRDNVFELPEAREALLKMNKL